MPHDCEPTGCLRPEGRGQRSSPRKTPFISSFRPEDVEIITTTTTTTTTTIDPLLFDLISYPEDSDCPLITTTLPPMYFDATGGSVYVHGGGQAHVFTSDGEFCILPYYESEFEFATIEYLVIGGGGAGGNNVSGGGGGGGQFKTGSIKLDSGCYQVSVGVGGENGSDGQPSSFAGITSIGGGGGGSVFFDGRSGANGGGAGGRAIGGSSLISGGYRGGTSLNPNYGGGGGGAGSHGETVFNNSTYPGEGGSGKSSTIRNGSLEYFAGGGAGGAKDGTQQSGGIGGGGGTLSKNGLDGTGGGGAALGDGGDGVCIIFYTYSTTTTTTTTLAPTVGPDAPLDLLATSTQPYVVSISWTPIENTGDCIDIYRYSLTYYNEGSDSIYSLEFDMLGDNLLQYDGENNKFFFSVSDLPSDLPYTFTVFGYNSCNLAGDSASVTIQHLTTTTTTTTTLPPENLLEFRFDFVDELEKGVISQSAIIFVGEQDSSNNQITIDFKVSDTAPENYVFLSKPSIIPIAGDFNYIRSIDTELFDGGRLGQCYISFIMPPSLDAQVTIGFYGEALERSATTTTTTTSTTPTPFCRSLYDGMIIGGAAPTRDPTDYKRRPAQIFISKNYAFPHQITGTSIRGGSDSGRPWYDGLLFEQSRGISEIDDYLSSLSENHNLTIPYTNFLGTVVDHKNIFYKLFYPIVSIDQLFGQLSGALSSESTNDHNLSYSLNIDFVCTVNEVDITGTGEGELEGFINIKFFDNGEIIHENTVQSIDERFTGSFTTQFNDHQYYYMVDFGTEEIKGKL